VSEDTSTVNASCKNIVINPEFGEQLTWNFIQALLIFILISAQYLVLGWVVHSLIHRRL
jgi:hypothetical protein